ncbi:MAG: LamG-like jellyroll fold domain-containing protein [Planctomycetia bacterium]|nr:LamG-like jellyroll fold domain-containing protein [Planctomycetia bacterium]
MNDEGEFLTPGKTEAAEGRTLELSEKYLTHTLTSSEADELLTLITSNPARSYDFVANARLHFLFTEKFKKIQAVQATIMASQTPEPEPNADIIIPSSYERDWDRQIVFTTDNTSARSLHASTPEAPLSLGQKITQVTRILWTGRRAVKTTRRIVLGLTVIVALCIVIAVLFPKPSDDRTFNGIARVAELLDAKWSDNSSIYRRGQILAPGELELESGLVKLEFKSGADIILEGPCRFLATGTMSNSCLYGRLSVEVPKQAKGFEIITPHGTIVDRGTAFAINADEKETAVEVAKGQIEIFSQDRSVLLSNLIRGQAAILDAGNKLKNYVPQWSFYQEPQEFVAEVAARASKQIREKTAQDVQMDSDPSLLLRLDFNQKNYHKLHNYSQRGAAAGITPKFFGGACEEGPTYSTHAVAFREKNDGIALGIPGEYSSFTLVAKVRLDDFKNATHVLLATDNYLDVKGGLLWQITGSGVSQLQVSGGTDGGVTIYDSGPTNIKRYRGAWMTLIIIVDGEKGTITHFLDGQYLRRSNLKEAGPYRFGQVTLGNATRDLEVRDRVLTGVMSDLRIFDRPLTAKEIATVSQTGGNE